MATLLYALHNYVQLKISWANDIVDIVIYILKKKQVSYEGQSDDVHGHIYSEMQIFFPFSGLLPFLLGKTLQEYYIKKISEYGKKGQSTIHTISLT